MKPHRTRIGLIGCAVATTALLATSLAGCTGPPPRQSGTASPIATRAQTSGATPVPTTVPVPTLKPELSASENLAYFDHIAAGVLAANPAATGRAFIDALVAGGFDKTQMELTADRTTANLAADSIQFSVRFYGACLIGQNGPASEGFHSTIAPPLGSGACLVGGTRQIDW